MDIGKFLKEHADHLVNIADSFATILDGLGIGHREAAKVHSVISGLRAAASDIHATLNAPAEAPTNPIGVVQSVATTVSEVKGVIS